MSARESEHEDRHESPGGAAAGSEVFAHVEDLVDVLWSRYCPGCGTRRPMNETTCPTDGMELRDLSVATGALFETTGLFGQTGGSWATLPPLPEGQDEASHGPAALADLKAAGLPAILGEKWQVERCLGGGSFGTFLAGHHAILGMKVGIKVLRKRFTASGGGRRLFHQEAMRLSLLHHPGIVQVLDYGEEAERPYLVMEYLNGKPLHHCLAEGGLSLEDGVEVVRQVAEALIAAHEGAGTGQPLVHLDLKPEHIFLERIGDRWHVKVIDFGIAEIAAAPTGSDPETEGAKPARRRLAGTLPYMAPERWQGVVDPRCDIYSLGIVLYEVVAGRKPFDAPDPEVMRRLHETQAPAPPSRFRPGPKTPALKELDAIVLKALEKDPADRHQTAAELARALERWQARPRLTPVQRIARAAALPAAVLALALGLVWWAPWEEVVLRSKDPVAGPSQRLVLEWVVRGAGYSEARLELRRGSVRRRFPLETVEEGGVIRGACPSWAELTKALDLGADLEGEEVQARIEVRGLLGRSRSSEDFMIVLDSRPPRFEEVSGTDDPGSTSLRLLSGSSELRVRAHELLDLGRCTLTALDKSTGAKDAGDMKAATAVFPVLLDAPVVEVGLVDLAGNRSIKSWRVDWVKDQAPPLGWPRTFLTNASPYPLELRWADRPGRVVVRPTGGGALIPVEIQKADDGWVGKVSVDVGDLAAGKRRDWSAEVRTWSVASADASREPDRSDEVVVRFLRRDLKVELKTVKDDEDETRFPVFRAADGEGKPVEEGLRWQLAAAWEGEGEPGFSFYPDLKGPSLDPNPRLGDRRGKFRLSVIASDEHGNVSRAHLSRHSNQVEPPRLTLALAADGGRAGPLHHATCPCNLVEGGRPLVRFRYSLRYAFADADDLDWKLRLGDARTGREIPSFVREAGECLVPRDEVIPWLQTGPNELFLIARDLEWGVAGHARCLVEYEAPQSLEILTADGRPLQASRKRVPIRVRVTGPAAKEVLISGKRAERSGEVYTAEVDVRPAGTTPVVVEAHLTNGCSLTAKREYSLGPLEGERYFVPLPGGAALELEYLAKESLWYTPASAWKGLYAAYAKDGSRRKGPVSSDAGVQFEVAHKVAVWVNDCLQPRLGQGPRFRLPRLEESKALARAGRPAPEREWLDPATSEDVLGTRLGDAEDERPVARPASSGGIPEPIRAYATNLCPFRLVLDGAGDVVRLLPSLAVRSERAP
ncbi:MAG: serine/threonine protein kinase [Planctomycetes bacterium]|nr:serine/threonine protein kinase [Planctomycetota bacterium]